MIRPGTSPATPPIRRRAGLIAVATVLALASAVPAWVVPTVNEDTQIPTPASTTTPVSARWEVPTIGGCLTGHYLPSTDCHSRPTRTLLVTGPEPSSPTAGKSLAFDEEFKAPIAFGRRWNGSTTSAYRYGNHDPDDAKLDWLTPSAITVSGGTATFTATRGSHALENGLQSWNTGLLTTEGTTQNFRTRTGDYAESRVQLPSAVGAWPAVWTWRDGGDEVDGFEYHPDAPNILELANHVHVAYIFYTDATTIYPGAWITVGVHYGATNDDWYLNGKLIYSDHTGVGTSWSPNIILNLCVSNGTYHPAPSTTTPITFKADYVRVWR
ncbi:beta-glucanase [Streptomyces sp. CG1]|uniref:glycoside hydrolase family 16 protein n=1 Tax=Streptomyces sp. CG1 TaxID=1287523 RepID=UPI0034E24D8F